MSTCQAFSCALVQGHSVIGALNRQLPMKFWRYPQVELAPDDSIAIHPRRIHQHAPPQGNRPLWPTPATLGLFSVARAAYSASPLRLVLAGTQDKQVSRPCAQLYRAAACHTVLPAARWPGVSIARCKGLGEMVSGCAAPLKDADHGSSKLLVWN